MIEAELWLWILDGLGSWCLLLETHTGKVGYMHAEALELGSLGIGWEFVLCAF